MKKLLSVVAFLGIAVVASGLWFWSNLPELKVSIFEILHDAQEANLDATKWQNVFQKNEELPSVYPITKVKNTVLEIEKSFAEIENLKGFLSQEFGSKIDKETVFTAFASVKKINKSITKIEKYFHSP